jgi:hypothetical protein
MGYELRSYLPYQIECTSYAKYISITRDAWLVGKLGYTNLDSLLSNIQSETGLSTRKDGK